MKRKRRIIKGLMWSTRIPGRAMHTGWPEVGDISAVAMSKFTAKEESKLTANDKKHSLVPTSVSNNSCAFGLLHHYIVDACQNSDSSASARVVRNPLRQCRKHKTHGRIPKSWKIPPGWGHGNPISSILWVRESHGRKRSSGLAVMGSWVKNDWSDYTVCKD